MAAFVTAVVIAEPSTQVIIFVILFSFLCQNNLCYLSTVASLFMTTPPFFATEPNQ